MRKYVNNPETYGLTNRQRNIQTNKSRGCSNQMGAFVILQQLLVYSEKSEQHDALTMTIRRIDFLSSSTHENGRKEINH
jgi:hypothetical protein